MSVDDLRPEPCPACGSIATYYDEVFDFHKCEACSTVWSTGVNDPDHDDDLAQAQEAIAERNIELIREWRANDS